MYPNQHPLQYIDVYIDDFIAAAQGDAKALSRVRSILLSSIDNVFRPLSPSDSQYRREPISIKKLLEGDSSWSTCKTILGWVVDTTNLTLRLPPHRVERLYSILDSVPPHQKRISTKKWQKNLGELRYLYIALPGS